MSAAVILCDMNHDTINSLPGIRIKIIVAAGVGKNFYYAVVLNYHLVDIRNR